MTDKILTFTAAQIDNGLALANSALQPGLNHYFAKANPAAVKRLRLEGGAPFGLYRNSLNA